MNVFAFESRHVANDTHELVELMHRLKDNRFGMFWISPDKYPVLVVGINGDDAWLNFIPTDDVPGFLSQGDLPSNAPDVEFMDEDGHIDMRPATCVVSSKLAREAASEFYRTTKRPVCVEWYEL